MKIKITRNCLNDHAIWNRTSFNFKYFKEKREDKVKLTALFHYFQNLKMSMDLMNIFLSMPQKSFCLLIPLILIEIEWIVTLLGLEKTQPNHLVAMELSFILNWISKKKVIRLYISKECLFHWIGRTFHLNWIEANSFVWCLEFVCLFHGPSCHRCSITFTAYEAQSQLIRRIVYLLTALNSWYFECIAPLGLT